MTAATLPVPAFVPPFFTPEENAGEVFLRVLAEFGYDSGPDLVYAWEYGSNLERLARLKTFICNDGKHGSFHCPRRVSVRMAARVALGEMDPPRFRVLSREWREVMTGGEREQFLSYWGY